MSVTDCQPRSPKRAASSSTLFKKIDQRPRMPSRRGERSPSSHCASQPSTLNKLLSEYRLLHSSSSDRWSTNMTCSDHSPSSKVIIWWPEPTRYYYSKQSSDMSDISCSDPADSSSSSALDFVDSDKEAAPDQPSPLLGSDNSSEIDDILTALLNGDSLETLAVKWNL
jgi:hypothetical protein